MVNGQEVLPRGGTDEIIYAVDGQYLQLFNTSISQFSTTNDSNDEQLLKQYLAYESNYIKNNTASNIEVSSQIGKTQSGQTYIYWHFATPENKNQPQSTRKVVQEHYLSVVCNQQILSLYGLQTEQDEAGITAKLLKRIAEQIAIAEAQIDLNSVLKL